MPLWNNNDREESKPTWLTTAQKRWTVRTNMGWEAPTENGLANLAGQYEGPRALSITGAYPVMELLVAMPNDPVAPFGRNGVTGTTNSAFADRITITGGFTGTIPAGLTQDNPWITTPYEGDGATSGGNNGLGLSHSATANYGLNGYGVSTLYWGVAGLGLTASIPSGLVSVTGAAIPAGNTGYIKVKANDVNFTQSLTLSLVGQTTGGGPQTHAQGKTIVLVTGEALLTNAAPGPTGVPTYIYEAFFGPTSSYNQDIGVIVLPAGLTTGAYGLTAYVNDGTTGINATGSASFRVTVR